MCVCVCKYVIYVCVCRLVCVYVVNIFLWICVYLYDVYMWVVCVFVACWFSAKVVVVPRLQITLSLEVEEQAFLCFLGEKPTKSLMLERSMALSYRSSYLAHCILYFRGQRWGRQWQDLQAGVLWGKKQNPQELRVDKRQMLKKIINTMNLCPENNEVIANQSDPQWRGYL